MNVPKQQLLLATVSDIGAWVRIIGQGTCHISPCFKSLMIDLVNRGFTNIRVDFAECPSLDSTFIGVLAKCNDSLISACKGNCVTISRPNARVLSSINNLGADILFHFSENPAPESIPHQDQFIEYTRTAGNANPGKSEVCSTSIEAHTRLCELSQENSEKFQHVLDFLKADLDSMK